MRTILAFACGLSIGLMLDTVSPRRPDLTWVYGAFAAGYAICFVIGGVYENRRRRPRR